MVVVASCGQISLESGVECVRHWDDYSGGGDNFAPPVGVYFCGKAPPRWDVY